MRRIPYGDGRRLAGGTLTLDVYAEVTNTDASNTNELVGNFRLGFTMPDTMPNGSSRTGAGNLAAVSVNQSFNYGNSTGTTTLATAANLPSMPAGAVETDGHTIIGADPLDTLDTDFLYGQKTSSAACTASLYGSSWSELELGTITFTAASTEPERWPSFRSSRHPPARSSGMRGTGGAYAHSGQGQTAPSGVVGTGTTPGWWTTPMMITVTGSGVTWTLGQAANLRQIAGSTTAQNIVSVTGSGSGTVSASSSSGVAGLGGFPQSSSSGEISGYLTQTSLGPTSGVNLVLQGGSGDTFSPGATVNVSGTIVQQRSVTASNVPLGRFMASVAQSPLTTLTSTGADNQNTRVTVAGTLFNGTTTSASYSPYGGTHSYGQGTVSDSKTISVTGEGLPDEGSYTPVGFTITGTAVNQRSVTAGALNLNRVMNTYPVTTDFTLTSTGADNMFTRVTVNGTLFNGTTTRRGLQSQRRQRRRGATQVFSTTGPIASNYNYSSLAVSGEGLPSEGTYSNITFTISGTSVAQRTIDSGGVTKANFGRVMVGLPTASHGITLTSSGPRGLYSGPRAQRRVLFYREHRRQRLLVGDQHQRVHVRRQQHPSPGHGERYCSTPSVSRPAAAPRRSAAALTTRWGSSPAKTV